MATLKEQVEAGKKRQSVLEDAAQVLDQEVADQTGLSGMAIKGAYKMVKGLKPGFIPEVLDNLLDDFLDALDPIYQEARHKGEMPGTYQDPYSRFGRLGSEIWRAIRLVVDTGLHARGWSEEQAVQYFLANSATTEAQARSEIRRYMVLPGQATSYKIGMLRIQELRRRAEAALGDRFDIRAFHDTVLGGGSMPLTILEQRVDRWIGSVPARP